MAIEISDTYYLAEALTPRAFRPGVVGHGDIGIELLRDCHRGQKRPISPLQLCWEEGSKLVDFTGTTSSLPKVVSRRMVSVLTEAAITGWSTFPLELRDRRGDLMEDFRGLAVLGKCGPLQLERSRVETRIGASGKPYKVKIGLFFDTSTWDGSDLFVPAETAHVLVIGKAKRALEEAKISNICFERLDVFERQW
jgi:hypothetical protein